MDFRGENKNTDRHTHTQEKKTVLTVDWFMVRFFCERHMKEEKKTNLRLSKCNTIDVDCHLILRELNFHHTQTKFAFNFAERKNGSNNNKVCALLIGFVIWFLVCFFSLFVRCDLFLARGRYIFNNTFATWVAVIFI